MEKNFIYLFLFTVWKRKKKLKSWVSNSNGSSSTQRHWVLVEAGPKAIESYCSDPTTLSDLQTEKTTSSTGATVSSTVMQNPTLLVFFWKCFGLAYQPGPTMLGPATKARPSGFWQRRSHLQQQFLIKNTGKKMPIRVL